jgi:hypothetical protein
MVGPVPGMRAHKLPTSVPRIMGKNDLFKSAMEGCMSRRRTFVYLVLTVEV